MGISFIGLKVGVEGVPVAVASLNRVAAAVGNIGNVSKNAPKMQANINLVKATGSAVVSVDQAMGNMGRSADTAAKKTNKLVIAFSNVKKQSRDLRPSLARLGQSMASMGGSLTTMGFRLGMVALPAIAGFGAAIKKTVEFEDALVKLNTLTGLTAADTEELGKKLREMAPTLGMPADELASAVYPIASRDIKNVADVLDLVTLSAKASAIGMGDVSDIAKTGATVFKVYGDDLGSTTAIFDKLLVAIQRGALEADEFSEPLGRALGLSTGLGISFDELTAFMAAFSISGTTASEVVTGMNRVMATFLKPTVQAKKALAEVFGTTNDQDTVRRLNDLLSTRGLAGAMKEIATRAEELGVPLSTIFTRLTGLNAALFTTGAAWDEYSSILADVQNAGGQMAGAFDKVQASVTFKLSQLKAVFVELGLSIGTALLPAILTLVNALVPMAQKFAAFVELHPKVAMMIAGIIGITVVIGPLLIGIGLMLSAIGQVITLLAAFAAVVGFLLTPIGLLIGAILLLGAAIGIGLVADLTNGLQQGEATLADWVDRAFTWGSNLIISFANGMADAMIVVLDVLIDLGNMISDQLMANSPPKLLPDLPEWGANAMNEFLRGFNLADFKIFNTIGSKLEALFRSVPVMKGKKGKDTGLLERILGSRESLSRAIDEFRRTGSVAGATVSALSRTFGAASADVANYVQAMFALDKATRAVAAAQKEVDEITRRYNATLDPLKTRANEIAEIFNQMRRDQERAKLGRYLESARAPEGVKEQARLRLEQLDLEEQIAAIEGDRDRELSVAERALADAEYLVSTLQDEVALREMIIDQYIQMNKYAQERIAIVDAIAAAIGRMTAARKGGSSAQDEEIEKSKQNLTLAHRNKKTLEEIEAIRERLANPKADKGKDRGKGDKLDIFGNIRAQMAEATQAVEDESLSLEERISEFTEKIGTAFDGLAEKVGEVTDGWNELGEAFVPITDYLVANGSSWGELAVDVMSLWIAFRLLKGLGLISLLTSLGGAMLGSGGAATVASTLFAPFSAVLAAIGVIIGGLTAPAWLLIGLIIAAGAAVVLMLEEFDTWDEWWEALKFGFLVTLQTMEAFLQQTEITVWQLGQIILNFITKSLTALGQWALDMWGKFERWSADVVKLLRYAWADIMGPEGIGGFLISFIAAFVGLFVDLNEETDLGLLQIVGKFLAAGPNIIQGLIDGIKANLPSLRATLINLAREVWNAMIGVFGGNLEPGIEVPRTMGKNTVPEIPRTYGGSATVDTTKTGEKTGTNKPKGRPSSKLLSNQVLDKGETKVELTFTTVIKNDMDAETFNKRVEKVVLDTLS